MVKTLLTTPERRPLKCHPLFCLWEENFLKDDFKKKKNFVRLSEYNYYFRNYQHQQKKIINPLTDVHWFHLG